MRPIDLSKLRLFYEIARENNLTRAAEKLNMTQPGLSRILTIFEDRIGTKLFERLPKGMRLTPQGERLYEYTKKILEEHNAFERRFFNNKDLMIGELKIITYPFVGSEWLIPNLKQFIESNPELDIQIRVKSDNLNLSEADVILATFMHHQRHLIQKPLFSARNQLFASKEYLKKYGIPQKPEDLNHHRLITYSANHYYLDNRSSNLVINAGLVEDQLPRESSLKIDSLRGLINSALQGYGIVELPDYSIVLNSGLEVVLPEVHGDDIPLYYIYAENRKFSKKINKLYEYLSKKKK